MERLSSVFATDIHLKCRCNQHVKDFVQCVGLAQSYQVGWWTSIQGRVFGVLFFRISHELSYPYNPHSMLHKCLGEGKDMQRMLYSV